MHFDHPFLDRSGDKLFVPLAVRGFITVFLLLRFLTLGIHAFYFTIPVYVIRAKSYMGMASLTLGVYKMQL